MTVVLDAGGIRRGARRAVEAQGVRAVRARVGHAEAPEGEPGAVGKALRGRLVVAVRVESAVAVPLVALCRMEQLHVLARLDGPVFA